MPNEYQSQINDYFDSGLNKGMAYCVKKAYKLNRFTLDSYAEAISKTIREGDDARECAKSIIYSLRAREYIFAFHKGKMLVNQQESLNLIETSCDELTFEATVQLMKYMEDKQKANVDRILGLHIPVAISLLSLGVSIVALMR